MNSYRRKTFEFNSHDISDDLKFTRRSSLSVNLSTDSGHGSYKKTILENNELACMNNQEISPRPKSIDKELFLQKSNKNKIQDTLSEDLPLKELRVKLIDLKYQEKSLSDNFEKLKIAILNKTKALFNQDNDLLIKTSMVLEKAQADQAMNKDNLSLINKSLCIDKLKLESSELEKEKIENIDCTSVIFTSTPKAKNYIRNSKNTIKLKHKHLFNDKNMTNLVEYIDINSPILSGSNQEIRKLRMSKRLLMQKKIKENKLATHIFHNKESSITASSTIASIVDDETNFMDASIKCSTFIKDDEKNYVEKIKKGEEEMHSKFSIKRPDRENNEMKTITNAVSMDITEVQNELSLIKKKAMMKSTQSNNKKTPVSLRIRDNILLKKKINIIKPNSNQQIEMEIMKDNLCSSKDSVKDNITNTSLKVNTSITTNNYDDDGKYSKGICQNSNKNILILTSDSENSDEETLDSSLNVNTSMDSIYKSIPNQPCKNLQQNETKDLKLSWNLNKNDSKEIKLNLSNVLDEKYNENKSIEGPSFIEGTPHLMTHSTIILSNLKNDKHMETKQNVLLNTNKKLQSSKQNTILLNDSATPIIKNPEYNPIIIEDSSNENNSNELLKDQLKKRGNRKRLLSLKQNSQLISLTPIEENISSPTKSSIRKTYKSLSKPIKNVKLNWRSNIVNEALKKSDDLLHLEADLNILKNKKKNHKPKKIVRKKIVIKKFTNADILEKLENKRSNKKRNKSMSLENDFEVTKSIPTQSYCDKKQKKITIVTTGLSKGDKSLVKSIVNHLGNAKIEANVTKHTTHVITTGVRTINLLHGIIRGCWLISLEWALKSLESKRWLEPKLFEIAHFFKAVMENRRDRQLFGTAFVPELFATCGFIYVQNCTSPPVNILKELIKAAGGQITENSENAKIIIGKNGIKETWIIDSITTGDLQLVNSYQR